MRNIVLAILAVALAALAPSATAAEGDSDRDDDDAGVRQPTMRELANKIDSAVRDIRGVQTTAGNLRTELGALARKVDTLAATAGTLSSTVAANHATIVGKFAPQMAVAVPTTTKIGQRDGYVNYMSARYLARGRASAAGWHLPFRGAASVQRQRVVPKQRLSA